MIVLPGRPLRDVNTLSAMDVLLLLVVAAEPIVLKGKPFPLVEAVVGWLPDWLLVPVGRVASRVRGVLGVTGVV